MYLYVDIDKDNDIAEGMYDYYDLEVPTNFNIFPRV